MKYWQLVLSQLTRKKLRTLFTAASILTAFLLFGVLLAVAEVFSRDVELAGLDRLVTVHKVSLVQLLPERYRQRIRQIEGVESVASATWFGGHYQDPKNFFAKFPVDDPQTYFDIYRELQLPPEQMQVWLQTRDGAVVGRKLADRFGWRIGDQIPIEADIWPRKGGSRFWEFKLVGIFDGEEEKTNTEIFMFRYDYFNEARQYGDGMVGWYIVKIRDPAQTESIARQIDALFANSTAETKTSSEEEFNKAFAKQWGDIGAIVRGVMGAVFFTLLLVVANTIAQSVRERSRELAVLKSLGFRDQTVAALVLVESIVLCLIPAILGLLFAGFFVQMLSSMLVGFLPTLIMPLQTWLWGIGFALVLGLCAALPPAYAVMRLRITQALRRV